MRLNVVEVPDNKTIVFTLAESTFMRNFEGRWQVCHTAVQFPAGVQHPSWGLELCNSNSNSNAVQYFGMQLSLGLTVLLSSNRYAATCKCGGRN